MFVPAATGSGASVFAIVRTGATTVVEPVKFAGPPVFAQVSPYVVVRTSPLATAIRPTSGSGTAPCEVARAPLNTPVLTPVSVSVTVSVSPVVGLFTVTVNNRSEEHTSELQSRQ